MAESKNISISNVNNPLGAVEIAPEVLEIIIGIAANKVEGVYQMRGSFSSSMSALFGRADHGKGVTLEVQENGISAEVYCYLEYGVSVPKVALAMQEKVKEQILFMTALDLIEVNVHVVGVVPEKTSPISSEDLFEEEDGENS